MTEPNIEIEAIRVALREVGEDAVPPNVTTLAAVQWLIGEHQALAAQNEELGAETSVLANELAEWRSGARRRTWPVVEAVPDGVAYAAHLVRAQGTEGGEEHDRLLREAAQRLKALHDAAQLLLHGRAVLEWLHAEAAWQRNENAKQWAAAQLEVDVRGEIIAGWIRYRDRTNAQKREWRVRVSEALSQRDEARARLRGMARRASMLRRSREKWRRLAGKQTHERVHDMAASMASNGQLRAENRRVKAERDEALAALAKQQDLLAEAVLLPGVTDIDVLLGEVRARFDGMIRAVEGHGYVNGFNECACGEAMPTIGAWSAHTRELRAAGVPTSVPAHEVKR